MAIKYTNQEFVQGDLSGNASHASKYKCSVCGIEVNSYSGNICNTHYKELIKKHIE